MTISVPEQLTRAAHAVAHAGLADAFGHVSLRTAPQQLRITSPRPLGRQDPNGQFPTLQFDDATLPEHAPKEAWLHLAVATGRSEVGAICRAQPPAVAAVAALGRPLRPLHGHGAFLGAEVPVFPDSRLIRDPESAARLAASLGDAPAIILRGNGAVTCGPNLESAVALMWVLERSAQLTLTAAAVGEPHVLSHDEQEAWRALAPELLPRIYASLLDETAH